MQKVGNCLIEAVVGMDTTQYTVVGMQKKREARDYKVYIQQALFLCNICVVFRPVLAFRDLLFVHALTNATDDHKYSPLPSPDFDSSKVLASFSAFIFT